MLYAVSIASSVIYKTDIFKIRKHTEHANLALDRHLDFGQVILHDKISSGNQPNVCWTAKFGEHILKYDQGITIAIGRFSVW